MTKDQIFFLQILRDYLRGVPSCPPENPGWSAICVWAKAHKVSGIVYAQCASLIRDPNLLRQLNAAFGAEITHAVNLRADYDQLRTAFSENGIRYVPIKGAVLSSWYPNPELRTMGDIDLLVRSEDREKIRDCLLPLGFNNTKWAEDEWHYRKNHSIFELQAALMDRDEPDIGRINDYFNDFWPHTVFTDDCEGALEPNFHFLYLVGHIGKHLRWYGVGFRQFYDLAVFMERSGLRLDWAWIRREAESIGFARFLLCCLDFIARWFSVPTPYEAVLSSELFEAFTEKIFADGVFGFENESNRVQSVERVGRGSGLPMPLRKLKASVRLVFPPYRDLIASPKYAFLRGRPCLLPCAWVRRAFRSRGSMGRRELSAVLRARQDQVAAREAQRKELGL